MTEEPSFAAWLREELRKLGYASRGGSAEFARQCGVSESAVSRALNGRALPDVDVLRRFGAVLGYNLGEMLVIAGVATADELDTGRRADGREGPTPKPMPAYSDPAEQEIWEMQSLAETGRHMLIDLLRILRRHRQDF